MDPGSDDGDRAEAAISRLEDRDLWADEDWQNAQDRYERWLDELADSPSR